MKSKENRLSLELLTTEEASVARIVYDYAAHKLPLVGEGASKVHPKDYCIPRLGGLLAFHRALLDLAAATRRRLCADYGVVVDPGGRVVKELGAVATNVGDTPS